LVGEEAEDEPVFELFAFVPAFEFAFELAFVLFAVEFVVEFAVEFAFEPPHAAAARATKAKAIVSAKVLCLFIFCILHQVVLTFGLSIATSFS